jgi:hypothetical protein
VRCTFGERRLWLVAETNDDPDGLNLIDEFSDNLCAYVGAFEGDITLFESKAFAERPVCCR